MKLTEEELRAIRYRNQPVCTQTTYSPTLLEMPPRLAPQGKNVAQFKAQLLQKTALLQETTLDNEAVILQMFWAILTLDSFNKKEAQNLEKIAQNSGKNSSYPMGKLCSNMIKLAIQYNQLSNNEEKEFTRANKLLTLQYTLNPIRKQGAEQDNTPSPLKKNRIK